MTSQLSKNNLPNFSFNQCMVIVILLSILPLLMNLIGFDFGSQSSKFPVKEISSWGITEEALKEEMFYALVGSSFHALVEWTAVMIAFIATILSFSYFAVNKDLTTPIIGVALFCSGLMDAFHTAAAMRLVDAVASNASLIPYTWTIARIFSAFIMITGAVIILKSKKKETQLRPIHLMAIYCGFGVASLLIIYALINGNFFDKIHFTVPWMARPYDMIPLILYIVAVPFVWKLYKARPTMLTAALVLSIIPAIVMQAHHTFGSEQLYDNSFNIAHILKILFFLIPLIGLILDYYHMDRTNKLNKSLIKKNENKLNSILDSAVDGIFTFNNQGVIDIFNPACERLFGFSQNEIRGRSVETILGYNDGDSDSSLSATQFLINRSTVTQKPTKALDGRDKSNKRIPLQLSISYTEIDELCYYTCIILDITDSISKDVQLNKTIEKLKTSNAELEKFAYISSHDLKSPLRAIDSLSKWIQEDLDDKLDETNKDRLHKLRARVTRMENLLNDLLAYSRVGKNFENNEIISGERLIRDVRELLNVPPGISFHVEDKLNTIMLPKMPIQHIFQNLINNSIKHHDKSKGLIQIQVVETDNFYKFKVKDDGPGIPPNYHEKIFEMFQTLKPRDEVEGSGMGLAMVKKLVGQFGGEIWVESKQGKGSTFIFKWPKNQDLNNVNNEENPS